MLYHHRRRQATRDRIVDREVLKLDLRYAQIRATPTGADRIGPQAMPRRADGRR